MTTKSYCFLNNVVDNDKGDGRNPASVYLFKLTIETPK